MKEELRRALWPNGPRPDVWAIVDAAQDQKVYWTLTNSFLRHSCLFAGRLPEALEMAAPYLVQLDPEDKFTTYLAENMGRSLGIFLRCDLGIEDVRHHLRTFLTVKDTAGRKMLFRYYDPRVLRVYLPTCTNTELQTVFGPVKAFWAEADQPGTLTQFEVKGKELRMTAQAIGDGRLEVAGEDLAPAVVPAQNVLVIQRGPRTRVPVLLQGAGAGAKLRRSSGAIRIYRTPTAAEELAAPDGAYSIPPANLEPDVTVYAEAAAPGEVTLTLETSRGGKARVAMTAVELGLETGGPVCAGVQSGRRRIDVLAPEPRAFKGRLQLRSAPGGPALLLYTSDTSEASFALADGFSFDVTGDRVSFWIAGEAASTRMGDATLQLLPDGGNAVGASCAVTIAEVSPVAATVSATPRRTGRLAAAGAAAPQKAARLTLLAGAGTVALGVETRPAGLDVHWSVARQAGDGEETLAASRNPVPALAGADLSTDAVGSFAVRAGVGPAEWGGPAAQLDLTLVHATVTENASTVNGRLCTCGRLPGTDQFRLHSGNTPAVQLSATLRLTGGGPDGRRGLDGIHCGWVANIVSDNAGARYKGGTATAVTYKYQVAGAEKLVDFEDGPLLDAAEGERCLPGSETLAGGERVVTVEAQMSPGVQFRIQDGAALERTIEQIWRYLDCQVYLTLWSEDAPEQLGVLLQTGWSFTGDYACTPAKTVRTVVPARLAGTRAVVYPAVVPAERTELEAHPPVSGRSKWEES